MSEQLTDLELDHQRSPLTGWTRDHHVVVADRSLAALRSWASPGHARFALPGPASNAGPASDGLEAFARSFLSVGFLLSGTNDDRSDHAGFYAAGLGAGTDPAAVDRWPRMSEVRQARVEAAALVIGLHESRAQIWDQLDADVQERLVDWLSEAVGQRGYGDNNWRWFQNVTQAFLRSVGGPYDQPEIEENLAFLDDCYLGGGWYSDGRPGGRSGNIDWYNAWVMHLFALWYCRILGDDAPPGLLDRYRARLAAFLPVGARLFGADGAPLFQGRSLVYRFATTAAFWAGPIFDVDAVSPGVVRRLGSGALRYFVEHRTYDDRDLMSLGWHGRFEPMRQGYSGPGSPYWADLGFAGLVLPDLHPVWADVEAEVPDRETVCAAPAPGWLIGGRDGITRIVNHGTDHCGPEPFREDPQYCRYSYSSATGPVPLATGETGSEAPVDNQVALQKADGRWSHRRPIERGTVSGRMASSRHRAHVDDEDGALEPGPEIATWSILRGSVEVRVARLLQAGPRPAALVISGFAVPAGESRLRSEVRALLGDLRVGRSVHASANPFGAELDVPWVRTVGDAAPGEVYAAAVVLGLRQEPSPELPNVVLVGDVLTITWPDGTVDHLPLERAEQAVSGSSAG